jgi:hypothetical protein
MKPFRLIKICLNETYSKVCLDKTVSIALPIQNGLKWVDALQPLLFSFALEQWYSTGGTRRHLRRYVKFKISIHILFHE